MSMKLNKCGLGMLLVFFSSLFPMVLNAGDFRGTVVWLEVWRNGNVAFTLSNATTSCNGQFILNVGDAGTKNQYAAVLAAWTTGASIYVLSSTCGSATGGSPNYNIVDYLYPTG